MSEPTLRQAIEMVEQLAPDDQVLLIQIVRRRLAEQRRRVLAEEIAEAREAYGRGEVNRGTVADLIPLQKRYVENIDGVYRLTGARVSLDSLVYAFWRGQTAESIAQSFPVLTLEQVYGALTFYLANKSEVDAYLEKGEEEFRALREEVHAQDPMFYQKLADSRRPEA